MFQETFWLDPNTSEGKNVEMLENFVFMQWTDKSPTLSLKCLNDNLWQGDTSRLVQKIKVDNNWEMYQHPLSHPRSVHQGKESKKTRER